MISKGFAWIHTPVVLQSRQEINLFGFIKPLVNSMLMVCMQLNSKQPEHLAMQNRVQANGLFVRFPLCWWIARGMITGLRRLMKSISPANNQGVQFTEPVQVYASRLLCLRAVLHDVHYWTKCITNTGVYMSAQTSLNCMNLLLIITTATESGTKWVQIMRHAPMKRITLALWAMFGATVWIPPHATVLCFSEHRHAIKSCKR